MYMDKLRKLFMALYWHDLDRLVRPYISREGKFKPVKAEEVLAFVRSIPGFKPKMVGRINEDSKKGAALHLLAQEFGPGCLFHLADQMSDKFWGFGFYPFKGDCAG